MVDLFFRFFYCLGQSKKTDLGARPQYSSITPPAIPAKHRFSMYLNQAGKKREQWRSGESNAGPPLDKHGLRLNAKEELYH
jgi:hypothetical protein